MNQIEEIKRIVKSATGSDELTFENVAQALDMYPPKWRTRTEIMLDTLFWPLFALMGKKQVYPGNITLDALGWEEGKTLEQQDRDGEDILIDEVHSLLTRGM